MAGGMGGSAGAGAPMAGGADAPMSRCLAPLVSPRQNGTTSSGEGSRPQAVYRNFSARVQR